MGNAHWEGHIYMPQGRYAMANGFAIDFGIYIPILMKFSIVYIPLISDKNGGR